MDSTAHGKRPNAKTLTEAGHLVTLSFPIELVTDRLSAVGNETLDLMDRCVRTFRIAIARSGQPLVADGLVQTFQAESRFSSDSGANAFGEIVNFGEERFF